MRRDDPEGWHDGRLVGRPRRRRRLRRQSCVRRVDREKNMRISAFPAEKPSVDEFRKWLRQLSKFCSRRPDFPCTELIVKSIREATQPIDNQPQIVAMVNAFRMRGLTSFRLDLAIQSEARLLFILIGWECGRKSSMRDWNMHWETSVETYCRR